MAVVAPTEHHLYIDGERVAPAEGYYDIVNPTTEQAIGAAPQASPGQVRDAVQSAREAFKAWRRSAPEERAAVLERAADALQARAAEIAPLAQGETGATMGTVTALQLGVAVARFRRYAKGALEPTDTPIPPQVTASTALAAGGLVNALAVRQPVGVVAAISAYNNPLANAAGKIAPALAMGNAVVVKPAEQNPLSVLIMAEALTEAGLPAGVCNVVTGAGSEIGQAVVDDPGVDMVSFTGSTGVGTKIAEVCGRQMKRQLMELGGKGAAVVFADATLAAAANGIGTTWSFYSGQICTAPTRVVVERSVHDELVERLAAVRERLVVGDPLDAATAVGPVISGAHRDRVNSYIDLGAGEGAEVVADRSSLPGQGFFVSPTMLLGCRSDMRVVQEEIFGPVLAVIPFDDEEEGIEIANDSMYGLIDYVWSADTARAYRVARRLEAGGVGINTVGRNMESPFGGMKYSGVGRDCGLYGLHAYSELQSLVWGS